MKITAVSKKTEREVVFENDFGGNLEAMTKQLGEEVVYTAALASFVIKAQGAARLCLNAVNEDGSVKYTIEEAALKGADYVPGVTAVRTKKVTDPFELIKMKIDSGEITEEEALKEIKARMAG